MSNDEEFEINRENCIEYAHKEVNDLSETLKTVYAWRWLHIKPISDKMGGFANFRHYFCNQIYKKELIEQQKIIDKKNEEIWDLKQELSDAEEYIKNIETVSSMWMNDYDALKNKYEPEILQQSEVESE